MDLLGKSLLELKQLVADKKIAEKEINDYFLKRIKKYNPLLNAYLTINQNIRGMPLAVKDNFCTRGLKTTASSKVLDNFIPPYESTVTQRLINNGFFAIGKTNMDAWAHGSSTETSDYRPSHNPWDLSRSPGGSSGGTAAAVSAYLAPGGIGSETAGSIRQPASWSGIIGLKPTFGRVSRYGVIAMGSSFDCPGPLTLTVKDTAYLLGLIAGKDQYDATSSPKEVPDYFQSLTIPKKYKIGIPADYFDGVDKETGGRIEEAVKILKKMGHTVTKIELVHPKYDISIYTILQRAEVSSNLSRYDGVRYGNDRSYFGMEAKRRTTLGTYTLSYGYYDAYYKKAQKVRTLIINDMKKAFSEVDFIVAPTAPTTALKLGEFEKYPFFGEVMDQLNEAAAVAGTPAINLPVGLDNNNMPIGIQIMGNYFEEEKILNFAYQFEMETDFFGVIKRGINNFKD